MESIAVPSWRARLRALVETKSFERLVVAVIVVNAITLGLETSATAMAVAGRSSWRSTGSPCSSSASSS